MRGNHWSVAGRSWALAPMLLLAGLAFSGTTALAEESAGPLQVFSVGDADFTDQNSNGPYLGATPMQLAGMTGGVVRFEKGKHRIDIWPYWYPEVIYVLGGEGRTTAAAPPFTEPHNYDVGPGDCLFVQVSTLVSFEPLSDEPFEFFFAIPN